MSADGEKEGISDDIVQGTFNGYGRDACKLCLGVKETSLPGQRSGELHREQAGSSGVRAGESGGTEGSPKQRWWTTGTEGRRQEHSDKGAGGPSRQKPIYHTSLSFSYSKALPLNIFKLGIHFTSANILRAFTFSWKFLGSFENQSQFLFSHF